MPAAAVIPAPIAYIKVVAVKKLVVGFRRCVRWSAARRALPWCRFFSRRRRVPLIGCADSGAGTFTLKKLECSKQAFRLNRLAWNNDIGLWFYFVGF